MIKKDVNKNPGGGGTKFSGIVKKARDNNALPIIAVIIVIVILYNVLA